MEDAGYGGFAPPPRVFDWSALRVPNDTSRARHAGAGPLRRSHILRAPRCSAGERRDLAHRSVVERIHAGGSRSRPRVLDRRAKKSARLAPLSGHRAPWCGRRSRRNAAGVARSRHGDRQVKRARLQRLVDAWQISRGAACPPGMRVVEHGAVVAAWRAIGRSAPPASGWPAPRVQDLES